MRVSARLLHRFHRSARFWNVKRGEHDSLPALQVAGVLVFVYIDRERGTLCVSVGMDTAHRALLRADDCVPLEITVQGRTVFRG
ncbi:MULTISPECIES: hypothetical protein [unclassified Streptomyces]|uniref:hypothetical protein n=1 Tax=unclassified Streptomyces TaxID=2593676 RepID=UPI002E2A013A|nr:MULTISPECIES: hypothetical protein [unclassified Streptomyces]